MSSVITYIRNASHSAGNRINNSIQDTKVGRFFQLEARNTNALSEFRGATATFMSMAYILAVNPRILSESGGPCVPDPEDGGIFGPSYLACVEEVKREYVTSTAMATMFACFFMGLMANLPIAVAPGMLRSFDEPNSHFPLSQPAQWFRH